MFMKISFQHFFTWNLRRAELLPFINNGAEYWQKIEKRNIRCGTAEAFLAKSGVKYQKIHKNGLKSDKNLFTFSKKCVIIITPTIRKQCMEQNEQQEVISWLKKK